MSLTLLPVVAKGQNSEVSDLGMSEVGVSVNDTIYVHSDLPRRYARIVEVSQDYLVIEYCNSMERRTVDVSPVRSTTARCGQTYNSPEKMASPDDYLGADIYNSNLEFISNVLEVEKVSESEWVGYYEEDGMRHNFYFGDPSILWSSGIKGSSEPNYSIIMQNEKSSGADITHPSSKPR
jgi:hypothetical protein